MKRIIKVYVEGGGDSSLLKVNCRAAFKSFLQKAGLSVNMLRILPCGPRSNAYSDYCTAIKNSEVAVLLVDSESPVLTPQGISNDNNAFQPWYHLKNRKGQDGKIADGWDKPPMAADKDCHMMVESMETWFLADIEALRKYYSANFNENSFPKRSDIENIPKKTVIDSLESATKHTSKGCYNKGNHSFEILEIIDPNKVTSKSPWAKRFIDLLSEKIRSNS